MCNDSCTGTLLNDMDIIIKHFIDSDANNIDPAPMLRLVGYQKRNSFFAENITKVRTFISWNWKIS